MFSAILGSVESQTPSSFTLLIGHLKFFSGKSFSFLPAIDQIHHEGFDLFIIESEA